MSERWRQQATWRICAELASGAKNARIVQVGSYVPGDYALAVIAPDLGQFATVSAAQGLQVTGVRGGASRSWAQMRTDGPQATARKALRALGLNGDRRPTTRRRRTYRVIASLLEAQGSAPERWDVVMGSLVRPGHSSAGALAASAAGPGSATGPAGATGTPPTGVVPDPWSVLDVRGIGRGGLAGRLGCRTQRGRCHGTARRSGLVPHRLADRPHAPPFGSRTHAGHRTGAPRARLAAEHVNPRREYGEPDGLALPAREAFENRTQGPWLCYSLLNHWE